MEKKKERREKYTSRFRVSELTSIIIIITEITSEDANEEMQTS